MKFSTKISVIFILTIIMLMPFCASAEGEVFNSVKIHFDMGEIPTITESVATFELYDEAAKVLLDTKTKQISRPMRYFDIEFTVPEFSIGTKFTLRLADGGNGMEFCQKSAKEHIIETFSYPDENGVLKYQTSFYMNFSPLWNKEAVIKVAGTDKTLYYHCLADNEVYVTLDLLENLGIQCITNFEDEKPSFTLTTYKKEHLATFYLNDIYAVIGSEAINLDAPVFEMNGWPFVPLSKVAQYFACDYNLVSEDEYSRVITLSQSAYSQGYELAKYVNSKNITSKTNYLIWISKKDFAVNVFTGSNKNWKFVKSLKCAIGAPSTPTIEGSYEYYQYQKRWLYDNYYCGPIMRFRGGYAIHSTLIKYDGTPYDNRVGMKISHGCIRLRPEDINWLASITPMGTRIYITP